MTKIYLFNNSPSGTDWNMVYAMADTGEVLAEHCCSHISFMDGDLHDNRPERKKEWKEKYGQYEIILLPQGEIPPQDVLYKNRIRSKQSQQSS